MIEFQVNDMTCGHCVKSIQQAIQFLDPLAKIEIDLALHRVSVNSVKASIEQVQQSIQAAGFMPTPYVHQA